ncbi:MAG: histidine kinase [Actinomycetota bacterium]|nr:histidine kinase [Actinomycetota bacterium]
MSSLRRALYGLGATGVILGLLALAAILTSDHNQQGTTVSAATTLLIGWSFIGAGLFAWNRFPGNRLGMLMSAVGFTWLLGAMAFANAPGVFIIGVLIGSLPIAILVHMVLSFPTGRLEDRLARGIAIAGYLATTVYMPVPYLFLDTTSPDFCDPACPGNPLLIADDLGTANVLFGVLNLVGLALLTMTAWVAVRRWRAADRDDRRTLGPSLWTAVATLLLFGSLLTASLLGSDDPLAESLYLVALAPLASVPYAFLAGLLRAKLSAAEEVAEENLRLDAELQARYEELRASRARIVEAADAARRKLERDLHDGAQQRLVGLALSLRLARDRLESDPAHSAALLEEASAELALATDELRELARGIHPAILTDRGLAAALDALAKRAPVDVRLRHAIGERMPAAVEAAAYFVVAEALTNVYRHSGSDEAEVAVSRRNGSLHVEVTDSGNGGADRSGSGLRGLADRVQAQRGELEVESEPGIGTAIHARIPVDGS